MLRRSFLAIVGGSFFWLDSELALSAEAGEDRLAIKGYDPVAYFTVGRPMLGDEQYRFKWDGAVYRFTSSEHLELFRANPERYVPQHKTFCTIMLSRGVKFTADPNSWIIHEGRLYLFGAPIGRERFLADPAGIKQRANENWQKLTEIQQ